MGKWSIESRINFSNNWHESSSIRYDKLIELNKKKKRFGKHNPNYKGNIKRKCFYCNKIILLPQYRKKDFHVFCNKTCYYDYRSKFLVGKKSSNYIHGNAFSKYEREFNKSLKEFIRKRDNYKCMNCDVPQKECFKKLNIHHIDYNKKNNDKTNLISLCFDCHALTIPKNNRVYWKKHYQEIQIERKIEA